MHTYIEIILISLGLAILAAFLFGAVRFKKLKPWIPAVVISLGTLLYPIILAPYDRSAVFCMGPLFISAFGLPALFGGFWLKRIADREANSKRE